MSIRTFVLALTFVSGAFLSGASQTIARKDLPMFVGSFALPDPQRPDSFDLSKFAEWFIDTLDSEGHRVSFGAGRPKEVPGRQWLALVVDRQAPWVCHNVSKGTDYTGYLFYIMSDMHGFMDRWDALTVWRYKPGTDSLEYVAAQFGYGTSIGQSWVQRIAVFPDNSLVLHARSHGSDDEAWGSDSFRRADSLFNFKEFYSTGWESDGATVTHVSSEHLCAPTYQVLEVTEFRHEDTAAVPTLEPIFRTDSARAEVIDLWQLAVEKLHIDTTRIGAY